jgi:GPH family glycoside/pentoside/hexuronide:cation symporter
MIRLMVAGVPIAGFIIAAIALRFFPLTQQRMAEIRRQLEARRGLV